jgi:parvulin-like peptidyl-prolyl isomerase
MALRLVPLLFLIVFAAPLPGVIVDRIAVAVGNKVITQSDIERRIRLTAFEKKETADFSLASRREAAEELINQRLVEKEMDLGRFPRVAQEHEKQLLAAYEKPNYQSDHAALLRALAKYGLSEGEFADDLARLQDFQTFLDLRFRPAVQVAEQDVQKYFDQMPGAKESLSALRPRIEQLLATERADQDLDDWLKDQRKRTRIEYVDKDLAPAGEGASTAIK